MLSQQGWSQPDRSVGTSASVPLSFPPNSDRGYHWRLLDQRDRERLRPPQRDQQDPSIRVDPQFPGDLVVLQYLDPLAPADLLHKPPPRGQQRPPVPSLPTEACPVSQYPPLRALLQH